MNKNGSIKYSQNKKDYYLNKFEKKCRQIMKGNISLLDKTNLNLNAMNALIELKNSLIKV